jgi:hypothetical protein
MTLVIFGILIIAVAAFFISISITAANQTTSAESSCTEADRSEGELKRLLEQEKKEKAENKILSSEERKRREIDIVGTTARLQATGKNCAETRRWINIYRYPAIAAAVFGALLILGGVLIGRRKNP